VKFKGFVGGAQAMERTIDKKKSAQNGTADIGEKKGSKKAKKK
jgi:hypothetical protein